MKSEGNKKVKIRKIEGKPLREVIVKIGLERIDTQKRIMVEALLDSGTTGLVIVKFTNSGLSFSLFYFLFLFSFCFIFLFLEQLELGLEVICHTVTSVTI